MKNVKVRKFYQKFENPKFSVFAIRMRIPNFAGSNYKRCSTEPAVETNPTRWYLTWGCISTVLLNGQIIELHRISDNFTNIIVISQLELIIDVTCVCRMTSRCTKEIQFILGDSVKIVLHWWRDIDRKYVLFFRMFADRTQINYTEVTDYCTGVRQGMLSAISVSPQAQVWNIASALE